ncbi:Uncharacterised protein [Mycobacteroides abscessus subsp. abscessus]|nr:Uncharacterised protein [Mycobacteroides abscessus subsp. abscessus]
MLAAIAAEYTNQNPTKPKGKPGQDPRQRPAGPPRLGRQPVGTLPGGQAAGGLGGGGFQMPKGLGGGSGGGMGGGGLTLPKFDSMLGRGGGRGASASFSPAGLPGGTPNVGGPATFGNYNKRQMDVAKAIVAEGLRRKLPPRAMQIAIATAMQESGLRVLANPSVPGSMQLSNDGVGHDHDSVGPFQQRQSWGPTPRLMNPGTSAGLFYDKLVRISGWESLPLAVAAQKVQVSAFPSAYAKHEAQAGAILRSILAG